MKHSTLILVLGLPGAGKTTLAKQLAADLKLPLISKDDIKVKLFDVYGWKDRTESRKAGSASYTIIDYIIEEQLRVGNSLIFESTFTPALDNEKFQNWQRQYSVQYVQVYCYADHDVIRRRVAERAATNNRHVSAIEGEEGRQDLEKRLARGRELLDIHGAVIEVDSTDFSTVDQAAITEQIRDAI
ncbi:MAG TPA: ATP-binding protein [Candidatus Saccharimonadales bacterium]|nr:ATP-binding protein [Candidatus Saccharimonadales bacterium]